MHMKTPCVLVKVKEGDFVIPLVPKKKENECFMRYLCMERYRRVSLQYSVGKAYGSGRT